MVCATSNLTAYYSIVHKEIILAKHPLNEIFGFPADNHSDRARRYRQKRLCPFNNKVPNCTKDKANDPLGVCSIQGADNQPVITCPIRFRQDWIVTDDAAAFFFPADTTWTSLTEVRINDVNGKYRYCPGGI